MNELSVALRKAQEKVIGIFTNPYTKDNEVIIENGEFTVTTITIGTLLGVSETIYSNTVFAQNIHMFPDNKTLSQMMDDPHLLDKWFRSIQY